MIQPTNDDGAGVLHRVSAFMIALISVLTVLHLGCRPAPPRETGGVDQPTTNIVTRRLTLDYVQNADPSLDAKESIRQGKPFFVGIAELGEMKPGVDSVFDLRGYPCRYIEGTNDQGGIYQDRAYQYALIFNATVVRFLSGKENGQKPR